MILTLGNRSQKEKKTTVSFNLIYGDLAKQTS